MKKLLIPIIILMTCIITITGCSTTTSPSPSTQAPSATSTTSPPLSVSSTSPASITPASPSKTASGSPSSPSPTGTSPQQYGGTLRIISALSPGAPVGETWEGNLNTYPTQQWVLQRLIAEKLDGTMGPSLATSWDINNSAQAPSLTFHLVKGAKFQDGTDLNAQAVKFNLEMYQQKKMYSSTTNYWKSFDILDDYTLRVNYTEWRNTYLRSWDNYFISSPTAYQKNGIEWTRDHMVGTGPFIQADFQRDVVMKATRSPAYYEKGKPYVDAVQVLYVADDTTQELLMKAGGAEAMSATPRIASRFQNQDVNIISRPNGVFSLVPDSLNAGSPFAKLEVRQALEYALDKASLARAFGYGFMQAAYQLPSPDNIAYDPSIPGRKYDPAKAKQQLASAGYPNGFETTIIINPGSDRDVLVAIQAQLAAVGIKASLDFPQPARMQEVNHAPVKPSTLIYYPLSQWANYNTSLNVYFAIPGAFNFEYSLKKPDGWKELYTKSLTAAAPDKTILQQANNSLYNDTTVVPVIYSSSAIILSPKVHDSGLETQPAAWDPPNVWLSK